MDGGKHVGLFGAIGRETRGAFRSIGYDLRRSPRVRRFGAIAVATVAGGVLVTGAVLRGEAVPGLPGSPDGDGSDIAEGWFGLGADTTGQDAESEAPLSEDPGEGADEPTGGEVSAGSQDRISGGGGASYGRDPDLVPIGGDETSGPGEEEGSPRPEEPTGEPTDGPSEEPTDEPTDGPSGEPTGDPTDGPTEDPTSQSPTEEPTPSRSAGPTTEQVARGSSVAPVPQKGPAD